MAHALRHAFIISGGSVSGYAVWRSKYDPLHVVWDLDATLLCSVSPIPAAEPHRRWFDQIDDDFPYEPGVANTRTFWRPGALAATRVIGWFAEQHVFTAAQASYTKNIMDALEPDARARFATVLHRDAAPECVRAGKDLTRVVGADGLRRAILVDDRARNFAPQAYENGVLTRAYDALAADATAERVECARLVGVAFLAFLSFDARTVARALQRPPPPAKT
jgi:hypothetical protein